MDGIEDICIDDIVEEDEDKFSYDSFDSFDSFDRLMDEKMKEDIEREERNNTLTKD